MSLKERIKSLAQDRGISLPALEAELGFGNSTIDFNFDLTPTSSHINQSNGINLFPMPIN